MRDHSRGPVEDLARSGSGYTRGQVAFLFFANAAAIVAVGSLIGPATAFIYLLALILGVVFGLGRAKTWDERILHAQERVDATRAAVDGESNADGGAQHG